MLFWLAETPENGWLSYSIDMRENCRGLSMCPPHTRIHAQALSFVMLKAFLNMQPSYFVSAFYIKYEPHLHLTLLTG